MKFEWLHHGYSFLGSFVPCSKLGSHTDNEQLSDSILDVSYLIISRIIKQLSNFISSKGKAPYLSVADARLSRSLVSALFTKVYLGIHLIHTDSNYYTYKSVDSKLTD